MPPYAEKYPVGTPVRVASRTELERFRDEWHLHNPLQLDQLTFAGQRSHVSGVGFYHGGDPLYRLAEVPGVWHEACLVPDARAGFIDL